MVDGTWFPFKINQNPSYISAVVVQSQKYAQLPPSTAEAK